MGASVLRGEAPMVVTAGNVVRDLVGEMDLTLEREMGLVVTQSGGGKSEIGRAHV